MHLKSNDYTLEFEVFKLCLQPLGSVIFKPNQGTVTSTTAIDKGLISCLVTNIKSSSQTRRKARSVFSRLFVAAKISLRGR